MRIDFSSRQTVLVVEDSADVRALMAKALKASGFTVAEAHDGLSALAFLRSGVALPSLIILDVRMPGMDGFQFRAEQTRDVALCTIPVLVYSAEHDLDGLAERLPAMAYLSKSAPIMEMVAEVRRAFEPGYSVAVQ